MERRRKVVGEVRREGERREKVRARTKEKSGEVEIEKRGANSLREKKLGEGQIEEGQRRRVERGSASGHRIDDCWLATPLTTSHPLEYVSLKRYSSE